MISKGFHKFISFDNEIFKAERNLQTDGAIADKTWQILSLVKILTM
jgi:hypothetical protein